MNMGRHEAEGVDVQRSLQGDFLDARKHIEVIIIFKEERLLPGSALGEMGYNIGRGQLTLGSEDPLHPPLLYEFIQVHFAPDDCVPISAQG